MPWLSQEKVDLPAEDVVSFALDHCDYDPDKPIYHSLEDESRTISWRQARTMVRQLVAGFRKAGLRKGDCFSITSFNDIDYSMVFLGGVGAGGIFSGTNPAYRMNEIRHHIKVAEVKLFIVEPEMLDSIVEATRAEGIPDSQIFVFNTRGQSVPAGFRSWRWLLEQGEEDWDRITDVETLKNTAVARLTTSGTTGLPKIALQSHYNGTSYHTLMMNWEKPWESRNLFIFPFFHVSSVPAVHISPLRSGTPAYVMRRFDLEAFLQGMEKYQITDLGIPPPLVIAIIKSPLRFKYSLRAVRRVQVGAAPLDAESQNALQALCAPDSTVTQVWGMTETTSALCVFQFPDEDYTGSVGNVFLPGTDVKLIDDDGNDITGYNVRGELCVRGPTIINGYYKNPAANKESYDEEGYLKSGDIVYCDEKSKKWYIVDRKKELIKVRGFQVAPAELESVLMGNSDILDCAVIGVKIDPESPEEGPRAYVVPRPGSNLTETAVKEIISKNLSSYKALTGGVVFVDEIPRNPSGKALRRVLRESVRNAEPAKAKL